MSETLKIIKSRRSIRNFKPQQVPEADLEKILDSAVHAPNGRNEQRWHFTVVQNKEMLNKMVGIIKENVLKSGNEFLKQRASSPDYNTFYKAPTVILLTADEKSPWAVVDCGAAMQNIALAAEALNIGSCPMTQPGLLFASEEGSQFKKELGIPEDYKFVCAVSLGYKNGETPVAPERTKDVINYVR